MHPELERTPDTGSKKVRKVLKVVFNGTEALVKFGKFAETEGVQTASTLIAMVAEEHVAPSKSNLSFSFEVSDGDDDDDVDDDDDNDDDDDDDDDDDVDFCMFVPSKEPVNEAMIYPAETKTKSNTFKQQNNPTLEQMEALIKKLQSIARKPPQAVPVTNESPSGSDKDASNASLMPRKRRRIDLRSGVLIFEPVQQSTSSVEPAHVIQDDQSPIVEPAQVHQDDQRPIVEPAQVHQDFQS
ncbi:unnamed protein product [Lactuca virosa]|uniref:Uncharacterized protein n=1 Tax=Lactuca virosa TaxID=75947 RepID=A0AAU9MV63_9ASTR|nr:unnamed protein product [Lactuca virosa]